MADFVAGFSHPTKAFEAENTTPSTSENEPIDDDPTDLSNIWNLRIYGSSNVNGSGVGIVLESPMGEKVHYALRLQFPLTNSDAEYEALIVGLRLVREMRLQQLRVYSDS